MNNTDRTNFTFRSLTRSGLTWLLTFCCIFLFQVAKGQNFTISGGRTHSGLVCPSGAVYTAGGNDYGEAGNGSTGGNYTSFDASGEADGTDMASIRSLKAGSGSHKLALGCDSLVYTWGQNTHGQLGNGDFNYQDGGIYVPGPDGLHDNLPDTVVGGETGAQYLENVVYVAGGTNTSYAVQEDGDLLAWGDNHSYNDDGNGGSFGMLGTGNMTDSVVPTPEYVRTPDGSRLENVVAVESGDENGYALTEDGTVYSWGDPDNTANSIELGRNNADHEYAVPVDVDRDGDGTVDGVLDNIELISGGDRHGLAIDDNGNVWSWGGNWGEGQLGNGEDWNDDPYAVQVLSGGQRGGEFLSNIVSVSGGQAHSVAIDEDGYAYSWGSNGFFDATGTKQDAGQLAQGVGETNGDDTALVPTYMMKCNGDTMKNARALSSGDGWTFVVTDSGEIYAAGYNQDGQLGVGDQTNRGCLEQVNTPCDLPDPCPIADIQPDTDTLELCMPISESLYAGKTADGGEYYKYQWFKDGDTLTKDTLATMTAEDTGQYIVKVWDERPPIEQSCEPCDTTYDTLNIARIEAPFEKDSAFYCTDSMAYFAVKPDSLSYKWFNQVTGGDTLNPSDSSHELTVHLDSTVSTPTCDVGVYVEDISSFQATAGESITDAENCSSHNLTDPGQEGMEFVAHADFVLDSLYILQESYSYDNTQTFEVEVYDGNPDAGGTLIHTGDQRTYDDESSIAARPLPVDFEAQEGNTYFVRINVVGGGQLLRIECNGSFSYWDDSGNDVLEITRSLWNNSEDNAYGVPFAWHISVGSQYPCKRLFVCADDSLDCTLPVRFSEFSVTGKDGGAKLEWYTASEKNTSHFIVMKSEDGKNFTEIGTVDANGFSEKTQGYEFFDDQIGEGTYYYKIISVDHDGTEMESSTKSYNASGINISVKVVPNPTKSAFEIKTVSGASNSDYQVRVLNVVGQTVAEKALNEEGVTQFDLSGQPSGMYTIRITGSNGTIVKKVVKQ